MTNKRFLVALISAVLLIVLIPVVFLSVCGVCNHREYEQELGKGVELLKENDAKIYAARNGFYLNLDKRKWQDKSLVIRNQHPLSIGREKFVYVLYEQNQIVIANIHGDSEISIYENLQNVEISKGIYQIVLSKDGTKLAYTVFANSEQEGNPQLVVWDVCTQNKRVYENMGRICDLCWAEDSESLFYADHKGINRLLLTNGSVKFIAKGYWPKVLSKNRLGYWRDTPNETTCCRINLNTEEVEELFSFTRNRPRGADWSPDGRYVVVMVFSDFFCFQDVVGLPILIDTDNGKKYRLPKTTDSTYSEFPFKQDEIQWVNCRALFKNKSGDPIE